MHKPNGNLRICLDPRPFNLALLRNHYPMRIIDDILPEIGEYKIFSVFDAKNGRWHVKLDNASSKLTYFNTVFGKYVWKRLPLGLNISSEEYQRRQEDTLSNLDGVFCIVDDVLVGGKGVTMTDAIADHDKNVIAFLQRCREKNIVLSKDKMKLKQESVKFIGHELTKDGVKPDKSKIDAIHDMPAPTDVSGVRRFLGMVNCLGKFIPHLSDICKPISILTCKDVKFHWEHEQEAVFMKIKEAISQPPVLKFYDPTKELTI